MIRRQGLLLLLLLLLIVFAVARAARHFRA